MIKITTNSTKMITTIIIVLSLSRSPLLGVGEVAEIVANYSTNDVKTQMV